MTILNLMRSSVESKKIFISVHTGIKLSGGTN